MFELSPQQGDAVRRIRDWFKNDASMKQVFVMCGFAGTGKSTILPDILDALNLEPSQVAFCAPTGKAAKVMGSKLRAQGIGVYPSTIHSLIYTPKPQKAEALERELAEMKTFVKLLKAGDVSPPSGNLKNDLHDAEKKIHILTRDLDRAYDLNDLRFSLNPDSRLVQDDIALIVVDEGSMVGDQMAQDLMDFEIPILVMGDPGQLPPVGEDPGFLNGTPDAFLTEVHRQAADNPIIHLATLVRKGQRGDYGDYGNGVLIVPAKKDIYTLDLDRDAQVIVGTNKNRWKQTSRMRKEGGFLNTLPHKGEPLIMCRNSRTYPSLVNGTQVYSDADHGDAPEGHDRFLAHIRDEDAKKYSMFCYQGLLEEHFGRTKNFATTSKERAYRSRINDHQLDFGWAITCHKSQGSQWDEVIVHDDSGSFREDADKWLYTAITRAAERLVIVA